MGSRMDWEPIKPAKDEVEAVEIDPEHPELVIIEIPINRRPEPEWKYFFENPKKVEEYTVPVHSKEVLGDSIKVLADRDYPVKAVKDVYKQIESANEKYRGFSEKKEDQVKIEEKEYEEDEKVLKEITERIRNA